MQLQSHIATELQYIHGAHHKFTPLILSTKKLSNGLFSIVSGACAHWQGCRTPEAAESAGQSLPREAPQFANGVNLAEKTQGDERRKLQTVAGFLNDLGKNWCRGLEFEDSEGNPGPAVRRGGLLYSYYFGFALDIKRKVAVKVW